MIEFKIVGLDKVTGLMNRLSPAKSKTVYQRALRKGGEELRAYIVKEELSGQLLNRITGRLSGSLTVVNTEINGLPAVIVRAGGGSKDVKYARIQEQGGTITAKNGGWLTFPIRTGTRFMGRGGQRLKKNVGIFQWVKVKSVTIKPKRYMAIAAKVKKDDVSKIVVDAINSLAGKANANTRYNI